MKGNKVTYLLIGLLAIMLLYVGCEKPYEPEEIKSAPNYLVVEGHLVNGETNLYLSRAKDLRGDEDLKEEGAIVVLEDMDNGELQNFDEKSPGVYTLNLKLKTSHLYVLSIQTAAGEEIRSDTIPVLNAPVLDKVEWTTSDNLLKIFVNSNNLGTSYRNYKYDFVETWEYQSQFNTSIEYRNGEVVYLSPEERYHTCYQTKNSNQVLITSTENLAENRVANYGIQVVSPLETNRLKIRYSILVNQYSLPPEAYEFYDRLKSNTENIGTLFDPQPSVLLSNLSTVEGNTDVIGYITAGDTSSKRIFIERSELPFPFYNDELKGCARDTIPSPFSSEDYVFYVEELGFMLTQEIRAGYTYQAASAICVDCRLQGGTTEKPNFW